MAKKAKVKAREKGKCLTTNCKRPEHARGLCSACLQKAYREFKKGRITEEQALRKKAIRESERPRVSKWAQMVGIQ